MIKIYPIVILTIITITLNGQGFKSEKKSDVFVSEFVSYFTIVNLPFSTYDDLRVDFHDFDSHSIAKYITQDTTYLKDWSGYKKEFASYIRFKNINENHILVIDETTECGTYRKLCTYDSVGGIISSIDFFAEKSFHGNRNQNEIEYYEIESVIDNKYNIYTQYFAAYPNYMENGNEYFKANYIEYFYYITSNGIIQIKKKIDHGTQKYKSGIFEDRKIPRWDLAE